MTTTKKRALRFRGMILFLTIFLAGFVSAQGSASVDDETCLECHDEMARTLAFTPHQLSSQVSGSSTNVTCSGCHEGGSEHADDPSVENITNPKNQTGSSASETCKKCHISHVGMDNFGYDPHAEQQLNCSSCHLVHTENSSLLLDDKAEFCYQCHTEKSNAFTRRSAHPVNQGNLTCLSCHQFTRRDDQNLAYDLNRICQDCHPQQAGPFLFEHDPVNGYSLEGSGCTECHDPHGAENDRLLKQRDNQICMQCHFPAGHQSAHGGIYADLACQTCHTETHGSMVSDAYLDTDLPARFGGNCYNTGCHSLSQ